MKQNENKKTKKIDKDKLKEDLSKIYENNDKELSEKDLEKLQNLLQDLDKNLGKNSILATMISFLVNFAIALVSGLVLYLFLYTKMTESHYKNLIFISVYSLVFSILGIIFKRTTKDMYSELALSISVVGFGIAVSVFLSNLDIFIKFSSVSYICIFFILHYIIDNFIHYEFAKHQLKKLLKK